MRKGGWIGALFAGALVGLIGAGMRRGLSRFEIAEHSMAPSLEPGDYVVVARSRAAARGDIVVFSHPDRPGVHLVKRVIGEPGERIEIDNGQVHVDGAVLAEPWADGPTTGYGTWTVDGGEIFVLGDRRFDSGDDGRVLGPVATDHLEGIAVFRYWPPTRIGRPA